MRMREPTSLGRRRFLAAAVAAACGWGLLPLTWPLAVAMPATPREPLERPLAAADLYAPHDLAG